MVERVTKILLTCRVKNKTKKNVARAIKKMLKPFKHLCHTITFDNGGEFAGHQLIGKYLDCKVYFAKPYHSWQRGLNENTNGLLRRFFPKGMAIKSLPKKDIEQAQLLINMRPRKAMNYSAASDRVSKQPKLLTMYFVLIHCFELILNVSPNDVLIRIANRLNKITLGPKLATPKILFPYL